MNEEYLWDRNGEIDPEMAQLEQLLGEFRYSGQPRRSPVRWWFLAAALTCVSIAGGYLFRAEIFTRAVTTWSLEMDGKRPTFLYLGQFVETGGSTTATVQAGAVGRIQIEPHSRFRLQAAGKREHRFMLDHGTIHALIWAPPAQFVVDTPAAKTVDLGCEYTLSVSSDGSGDLTVNLGWVAFQWKEVESFIPAGARCITRRDRGPGTPFQRNAPLALVTALAGFDRTGDANELRVVLGLARKQDALTLWHLLSRTHGTERAEVFDRFAKLVILPPSVTRDAIVNGNSQAFDAAWNALDLGDTSWWRTWKRPW